MKAIVYKIYGSPDVLQLKEVEKPAPKDNEVLVKVYAASANAADWHLMRAEPFLARLENGLLKPKNTKLGADIAGRVEAVGKNVTQFQAGDEVFGGLPLNVLGGFAEYVCANEDALALKPARLTFEQAAAVPLAAFTALQGLRDKGQIGFKGVVVSDDLFTGYRYFATATPDGAGAPMEALAKRYLNQSVPCPTRADYTQDWAEYIAARSGEHGAQGVVVMIVKFCEPHMIYYPHLKAVLAEAGVPHVQIETEHEVVSLEGIRTRLQAFIEMLKRK